MRNFNTRFRLLDTDRQIRLAYTLFVSVIGIGFAFTLYWAYTMNGLSSPTTSDQMPPLANPNHFMSWLKSPTSTYLPCQSSS